MRIASMSIGGGSKQELQRELDLPRGRGRGNDPRGRAIVIARENDWVGRRKVGMVEEVEGLHPKLQIHVLSDAELLEQRGVKIGQPRPYECPARHIPESPGKWLQKSVGIEPLVYLA